MTIMERTAAPVGPGEDSGTPGDYRAFLVAKAQLDGEHGFEPLWMPDFLFPFQRHLVEWAVRKGRAAIFADCGLGKGHPVGTPILTPNGWRPIESLRPGDAVIGSHGAPVAVLGLYDRGALDVYRVAFRDGASTVVDGDHLWTVKTMNDRARARSWRTMETRALLASDLCYGAQRAARFHIPMVAPVQFAEQHLAIDPYLLGVLLGDGGLTEPTVEFTATNPAVVREVVAVAPGGYEVRRGRDEQRAPTWRVTRGRGYSNVVLDALRTLGLSGLDARHKFVPQAFLLGSVAQRLALLQGLMDTDGELRPDGLVAFGSTSRALAEAVQFLVESLGGSARLTEKRPRVYNVTLCCPPGIVPVRAKAEHYAPRTKYKPARPLAGIEPAGRAHVFCLAVDAPDQLYVTERCIVTHNTPMQLVWAENVRRKTGKPVLILTPLAVAFQTRREAEKFGVDVAISRDGRAAAGITIANYERLHLFDRADFGAVVCDESSAIKAMDGVTRTLVTAFMRHIPYRLLCTATAAPNDYIELGTSSEALGYLGYTDMLGRFFVNDDKTIDTKGRYKGFAAPRTWGRPQWRFKGHAEGPFWRWVSSWARALRRPSDYGFSDQGFILPRLAHRRHVVTATVPPQGMLFPLPALGLNEERDEARRTIAERCDLVAGLLADAESAVAWCQLNAEGDELTRRTAGAVQVSGSDDVDRKEEILRAFSEGQIRVLVTKPKIGAWGLNWQHCRRMTFFPSHSYEQYYQAVRRSWRFGQTQPVVVDIVATEGSANILANLERKAAQADRMFTALVAHMNDAIAIGRSTAHTTQMAVPPWLQS